MTLVWTVLTYDLQSHWRSTYGHPSRRRRMPVLLLVLALAHMLAVALGHGAPLTQPAVLGLAFCVNALGRGGIDVLETVFLNGHFNEWRLAPLTWGKVLLARYLSNSAVRSIQVLLLMSPVIFQGSLHRPAMAWGYLSLPIMATVWYAAGWTLLVPLLYRFGPQAAQFAAQSWRYLVLAAGAYIMIRQPAWGSWVFGWWATNDLMMPGLLASVCLACTASWIFVVVAKSHVMRQLPLLTAGGQAGDGLHRTGLQALIAKEWRLLIRTPKYWAGLITFPILEVLVALVAFGNNRPAFMANLAVFSPALLAMVVAEYLVQNERDHIPLLFLAPTPCVRQMVAKAYIPLTLSLPMVLAGALMLDQNHGPGIAVAGAATGVLTSAFAAYVTVKQGFERAIAGSPGVATMHSILSFAGICFACVGIYLMEVVPGSVGLVMDLIAMIVAMVSIIRVPRLPVRVHPPLKTRREAGSIHAEECKPVKEGAHPR